MQNVETYKNELWCNNVTNDVIGQAIWEEMDGIGHMYKCNHWIATGQMTGGRMRSE